MILSPERHMRWLKVFEPAVITGIVQPLAAIPSISKLYFTHTQHASGQSLATWSIFAVASLLWFYESGSCVPKNCAILGVHPTS